VPPATAPRVIIVVPASLRAQWQVELGSRFGVECLRADRRELEARSAEGAFGENPWRRAGVWLVSTDFLKQGHVLDMLPRDAWDLVVIDEAHGVCGDSDRYHACHELAKRSRRVLLLTATPHSGDAGRFARLTRLGAFDGLAGSAGAAASRLQPPLVFRRTRDELAIGRRHRVSWHAIRLSDAESRALGALQEFEQAALRGASRHLAEHTRLVLSVFRKRALSTFTALSLSITRRLRWLDLDDVETETPATAGWTQASLAFDADNDDSQDLTLLAGPIGLDPRHERTWLRRLRQLADDAARCESKIARLKSLVERTAEPVVVFSEFRDSLDAVERRLRRNRAIAVMHGGQDEQTQRSELARYLGGPASVLLATDVAGQGLNLQSRGRWVISLELPWNPARLEQRLGRVDRLGQKRTPHLSLLVARHKTERGLLSHLARRVLGAQRSFSKDVLRDVLPPESHVRATLLSDDPPHTPTLELSSPWTFEPSNPRTLEPSLVRARRWQRPARVIAHELSERRSLARRWRNGSIETARTIRARLNRRPTSLWESESFHSDRPFSIVIGVVPILNGQDEVIEQRVVALAVEVQGLALRWRELAADSKPLIETALRRRVLKLSRVARDATAALAERETAILSTVLDGVTRREGQPGLFDASELRVFLAGAAEGERLRSLSDCELQRLQAFAGVRLGGFEPEFVLDWPHGAASAGRHNAR
jgi:superfamily II DNA or RNA helicase